MTNQTFILVGAGRAGTLISKALIKSAWTCIGLIEKDEKAAQIFLKENINCELFQVNDNLPVNDLILFALSDDIAETLIGHLNPKVLNTSHLMHLSGFKSSKIFRNNIKELPQSIMCHSFHPLFSIPDKNIDPKRLKECYFGIEGDDQQWMEQLAGKLGKGSFLLDAENKKYYHTAAVMAANLPIGLFAAASKCASIAGFDEKNFIEKFIPLIRSVLDNMEKHGIEEALSGPIQRGDEKLLQKQEKLLETLDDDKLLAVYQTMKSYIQNINKNGD